MNPFRALILFSLCGGLSLLSLGCPYDGTRYPTIYGMPTSTPTPTSSSVAASNFAFSPSAVTITRGGSVTFTNAGGTHTVYLDNGAGTCATNYTVFPTTVTFATAGTYYFHCQYHSSCGTTTCGASCTGMAGFVVVQ